MDIGLTAGAVFCTAVAFVGTHGYQKLFSKKVVYLKGSQLVTPELQPADASHRYLWGNSFLNFEQARKHFLAVGAPGSGKTITVLLLLKSVLARMMEPGSDARLLLYDSKNDFLSYLATMVPSDKIRVLNPLDTRCHAWDMAKDITHEAMAKDLACALVPLNNKDGNPYFPKTARTLLAGVIKAFMFHGNEWTLRDVLLATLTPERLKEVLLSYYGTEHLMTHFKAEVTFNNIHSTLDSALEDFRGIAAAWEIAFKAGRKFTINDGPDGTPGWISTQEVLVMGNSTQAKEAISGVNQLLCTQVAKAILDREGYSNSENWIVLDEFRELGMLPYISDLMITGRSKGAAVFLGFQDISGVEEIYGEKRAREIVGCTTNVALLHLNSTQPDTQVWASKILGDVTFIYNQKSGNTDAMGRHSTGVTSQRTTEKEWLPTQFEADLPAASLETGMVGLFKSTGRFYKQSFRGEVIFGDKGTVNRLPRQDPNFKNREPIQPDVLRLKDWDEKDVERLKIPELNYHISARGRGEKSEPRAEPPAKPQKKSSGKATIEDF